MADKAELLLQLGDRMRQETLGLCRLELSDWVSPGFSPIDIPALRDLEVLIAQMLQIESAFAQLEAWLTSGFVPLILTDAQTIEPQGEWGYDSRSRSASMDQSHLANSDGFEGIWGGFLDAIDPPKVDFQNNPTDLSQKQFGQNTARKSFQRLEQNPERNPEHNPEHNPERNSESSPESRFFQHSSGSLQHSSSDSAVNLSSDSAVNLSSDSAVNLSPNSLPNSSSSSPSSPPSLSPSSSSPNSSPSSPSSPSPSLVSSLLPSSSSSNLSSSSLSNLSSNSSSNLSSHLLQNSFQHPSQAATPQNLSQIIELDDPDRSLPPLKTTQSSWAIAEEPKEQTSLRTATSLTVKGLSDLAQWLQENRLQENQLQANQLQANQLQANRSEENRVEAIQSNDRVTPENWRFEGKPDLKNQIESLHPDSYRDNELPSRTIHSTTGMLLNDESLTPTSQYFPPNPNQTPSPAPTNSAQTIKLSDSSINPLNNFINNPLNHSLSNSATSDLDTTLDLDQVMDAIAREVARDYHRFYGD